MSVYLISYDLHSPDTKRELVEKAIQSLGVSRKFLTTTYLVSTYSSSSTITATITEHFHGNDRLIVSTVDKDFYGKPAINGWLTQSEWDWIKSNL